MFKPTGNTTESLPEKIEIASYNPQFSYQNSCMTDKKQLLEERFLFSRPLYICSTDENGHCFYYDEAKSGSVRKSNKVAAQPAQSNVCGKFRKGTLGTSEEDTVRLSGQGIREKHLEMKLIDGCTHTLTENISGAPEDCTTCIPLNTQARHQTLTRLKEKDLIAIGNDTVFQVVKIETFKYVEDSIDWASGELATPSTKVRFGHVTEITPKAIEKGGKSDNKTKSTKDDKDLAKGQTETHFVQYPKIFDVAHSKRTHRMITEKEAYEDNHIPVTINEEDLDPRKHSKLEPTKHGSAEASCDSFQRHSVKSTSVKAPQLTILRASSITLKVLRGPSKGMECVFTKEETNGNIGTDDGCKMILDPECKGVSPVHCKLSYKIGGFYIEDNTEWHYESLIPKIIVDKKGKILHDERSAALQRKKPYVFKGVETRVLLATDRRVVVGDRLVIGSTIFEFSDVAEGYGSYSKMYDTDHLAIQMTARRVYRAEALKNNGFDPAFLSLESGEAEGVAFGRSTKCSVSIRDIFMSEFHFAINFDENEFQYNLECNSALKGKGIFVLLGRADVEGTNFQHTAYAPVELSEGDVVMLGGTELKVVHINHGIQNVNALIEHQNKKFEDIERHQAAEIKAATAKVEESSTSSNGDSDSEASDLDSECSESDSETDSGSSADDNKHSLDSQANSHGSEGEVVIGKKKKRKKKVKPLFVTCIDGVDMCGVEGTFSCLELEATSGPRRRQKWAIIMSETLPNQKVTIGKGESADVQFSMDTLLEEQHTMIEYHNGGFWIRDLQSKWGTYGRVGKGYAFSLKPGDVFVAGSTEFFVSAKLQIRAVRTAAPCCSVA